MNSNLNVQLYKNRKVVWLISLSLSLLSIMGMLICYKNPRINAPLNLGLDYTGGTQIILDRSCSNECLELNTSDISKNIIALKNVDKNFESNSSPNLTRSQIQLLDNSKSISIRLPFLSASQSESVVNEVTKSFGPFINENTSVEIIGPSLGKQLLKSSLISLFFAFLGIALYINFRYDRRYSFLALFALFHDVLIVCGVFSWLGYFYNIEVDSLFAVSLLTIAGYSVNNTVVVFDRIREKSIVDNKLSFKYQIDKAVGATLTRTLYTSFTTLLPLICILIWGGSTLYWFAFALVIGVIAGSWSSIALAPSLLSITSNKEID
ncbi:protein translocase subunit SecF [Prochlorococcus marinus]|uniref:Protein translocase subunit SecF n=1 Tax=Prochlorococcus marinus XMU1408 TaxID=2213228 RepID=A0A318R646_PROMR|nr:protein translocase subunit SecF [Prochlorococcus marinus]MBW3041912.1 protein translocase subunit SecF [Prochlorococcus marinus str. XMU1408]PYE03042.1 protein translocase subunit SecF [Prochlorococcus marinus XMU1408]